MKVIIDIPDDELKKEVFEMLTHRLADQIFADRWNQDERAYRKTLKEAVNAVLKERADDVVDRCISQAAAYIGKKGVKKFADELCKEATP